jgi:diguanylate cyclase (GGDEF)-like protein
MNIEDDSYIDRLYEVRKEESSLVDRLVEERKYLADTVKIDPLTGLYNRRILPKIREIGTVIMCDIDYFKTINDTFGHDIGDEALKAVGTTILDNIRVGDVACRLGGDEFLIVFTTDKFEVIDNRMKKIVDDINKRIQLPDLPITLSVGVVFNEENEQLDSLMEKADTALYQSKENGRNQVSYYGMDKRKNKEHLLK